MFSDYQPIYQEPILTERRFYRDARIRAKKKHVQPLTFYKWLRGLQIQPCVWLPICYFMEVNPVLWSELRQATSARGRILLFMAPIKRTGEYADSYMLNGPLKDAVCYKWPSKAVTFLSLICRSNIFRVFEAGINSFDSGTRDWAACDVYLSEHQCLVSGGLHHRGRGRKKGCKIFCSSIVKTDRCLIEVVRPYTRAGVRCMRSTACSESKGAREVIRYLTIPHPLPPSRANFHPIYRSVLDVEELYWESTLVILYRSLCNRP